MSKKVLGIKVVGGSVHWVLLEGTFDKPTYLDHRKEVIPSGKRPDETANWAETVFTNILSSTKPEAIVYRLTIPYMGKGLSTAQVFNMYFPLGVLNLVASRAGIDIKSLSPQATSAPAYGLAKGANPTDHVLQVLGKHPPYWNGEMLDAAGVALLGLK